MAVKINAVKDSANIIEIIPLPSFFSEAILSSNPIERATNPNATSVMNAKCPCTSQKEMVQATIQ